MENRHDPGYTVTEVSHVIFRKHVEPACTYCRYSSPAEEGTCICLKRGIVSDWDSCRRFSYDPLRRVPEASPAPRTEGLDQDAFSLD